MDSSSSVAAPYTILRIKRRRDEEPLDALVVEGKSRRKRTKGAPGVFQYAETVEDTVWNSEQAQKEIQEKISRIAREKAEGNVSSPIQEHPSPLMNRQGGGRRYTIMETGPSAAPLSPQKKRAHSPASESPLIPTPPISQEDFKMYDAVLSTESEEVELDPEMEKFNTMLKDYLTVNEVDLKPTPSPLAVDSVMKSPDVSGGDYVWDVFYHRPATLTEWNDIANVGTLSGFPALDGDTYSSDSESEEEDEADEDSNAEEFYRNDYPEDEEEDSDEWHEDSENEDMMHDRGDDREYDYEL